MDGTAVTELNFEAKFLHMMRGQRMKDVLWGCSLDEMLSSSAIMRIMKRTNIAANLG